MKKFISALTSLTIAATALGGTFALSTNAINEKVDSTIIDIRTGTSNEITAKAGDTIPVSVYIPQSAGFNSMTFMFAINDGQPQKTLKTDMGDVQFDFKNYGFTITSKEWPYPCAVDSGYTSWLKSGDAGDAIYMSAGLASAGGYANFYTETWSGLFSAGHAIMLESGSRNIDAFGAWEAAGGNVDLEDFDYANYTPAYTWQKSEAWADKYPLLNFELKVPDGIKDGVYKLNLYDGTFVNVTSIADAEKLAAAGTTYKRTLDVDEDPNNDNDPKIYFGDVGVNGIDGANKLTTVPLTIKVGDVSETTTASTKKSTETTTASTSKSTETTASSKKSDVTPGSTSPDAPEGTIKYEFVPSAGSYDFDGTNNVVKVAPGEQVTINWTVANDPGIAGMQYYFDFSELAAAGGTYTSKAGRAYRVNGVQVNPADTRFDYVFASGATLDKATDGATIYSFTITAPTKDGSYIIDELTPAENDGAECSTVPITKGEVIPHVFYGLKLVVGEATETTTASTKKSTETTTASTSKSTETTASSKKSDVTPGSTSPDAPEGTIKYEFVPSAGSYDFDGTNNVVKVAPGEQVTINWTVANDPGIAGMQYYFDFSELAAAGGTYTSKAGRAYRVNGVQVNPADTRFDYVFASGATLDKATDGATIYSFTITAPTKDGSYIIDELTPAENDGAECSTVPITKGEVIPHVFYGLKLVVGETATETTTESTFESTETTTVSSSVSTETTTKSTESTKTGDILWGDTNCDGKVSIADVVLLNKGITNADKMNSLITAQGQKNADCKNDGTLDAKDATAIKKFLAKLIAKLPEA